MDGHMYFDNQVFKIRYDTMINTKSDNIKQEHYIDKYANILDLKKGERVLAKMPKLSLNCHKTIYLVSNQPFRKPYKLIILPYLHERRLYLNNLKPSSKYFYTIFENWEHSKEKNASGQFRKIVKYMVVMDVTGNKFFIYSEGGLLIHRFTFD